MTWEVTIMNNPGVRKRNLHPGGGSSPCQVGNDNDDEDISDLLSGIFLFFLIFFSYKID